MGVRIFLPATVKVDRFKGVEAEIARIKVLMLARENKRRRKPLSKERSGDR